MIYIKKIFLAILLIIETGAAIGQTDSTKKEEGYKGMVVNGGDGRTMQFGFTGQVWIRQTQTNPGSTVYGDPQSSIFDIGLRRTRLTIDGDPLDKVHVFVQYGMNNFNYLAERQAGFFFHDAVADYEVSKKFYAGGGLTAWGGFSRFSSPSIASILGVDAPLFAQATNGATDQFLRKLSVYAKGDLGQFSYSLAISKPMAIQRSSEYRPIGKESTFSDKSPNPQVHGYFQYAFFDLESHKNPYYKGTWLGKKKVFNVGVGFLHQTKAMQHLSDNNDTVRTDLTIFSADVFYDVPTRKGGVINLYGAYYNYNFGKGYLRNNGAMNPANGNNDISIVNGAGSAYPQVGTGNIGYVQGGYMFPVKSGDENKTRLMPYASFMIADYDALNDLMTSYDTGLNIFFHGHRTKLTLAYQNRPIFKMSAENTRDLDARKGLVIAQFQVSI